RRERTRPVTSQNPRWDRVVYGNDLLKRHLFGPRLWIRTQPGCGEEQPDETTLEFLALLFGHWRCPLQESNHPIEGKIPLGAFDQASIRHHTCVAHPTGEVPQFHLSLFPDHIACEREHAIPGGGHTGFFVPLGISYTRNPDDPRLPGIIVNRRIEDEFTGPDPVGSCLELARIEDNFRFMLLEALE